MRTSEVFSFIKERHAIYIRRKNGKPKPWTTDLILQQYRFCNAYRELDTVTQWIAKHWRFPHRADSDLWFAMTVARFINWPPTLEAIGYPVPYQPTALEAALERLQATGAQVFTGAYMVRSDPGSKVRYLTRSVFKPLWEARSTLCAALDEHALAAFHSSLHRFYGVGSFMAGQVVADLKYVLPLSAAVDWWTWAASGPGSRRGLNRALGFPKDQPWNEVDWLLRLQELHREVGKLMNRAQMPEMHAQDFQNCLCEYDKWCRVKNGEGRPRSRYPGI